MRSSGNALMQKNPQAVLITGACGGIGRALCSGFRAAGWTVIATDHPSVIGGMDATSPWHHLIPIDLAQMADEPVRKAFMDTFATIPESSELKALVNNAAVQRLGSTDAIRAADWRETFQVNVEAPMFLTQALLAHLERNRGSVINIGSIHAKLTKPGFVAYATSKAALSGLTRALAVDLGARVRVNAICPAAIATPMLEAGFADNTDGRRALNAFHPTERIGQPDEVARVAVWLASADVPFLNGACVDLDGGIGARLHDPA
jgi:NAD(P)-dependent dehydrogenase (short-subunit alcohol dehydrogenase family)